MNILLIVAQQQYMTACILLTIGSRPQWVKVPFLYALYIYDSIMVAVGGLVFHDTSGPTALDCITYNKYRKVSNIRWTLVGLGNKIVDHSDIVGASPVGATPTTSSFST